MKNKTKEKNVIYPKKNNEENVKAKFRIATKGAVYS